MNLEVKHLSPYLPYSLKVMMEGKKCNVAWMSTKNIAIIRPDGVGEYKKINWKYAHLNILPILKPLSDLKVGGKSEHLLKIISDKAKRMNVSENDFDTYCHIQHQYKGYDKIPHWWFQDLVKHHFDIFNLIEKGLACSE